MKKTILFTILSIISLNMIHAQNCQLSEEAEHHWRRANAIAENLKTSESYYKAIDEFTEVMILAPNCPDVYYNLSVLYGQWAKLDSYDTYRRLNIAELFVKVCLSLNPVNKNDAKNQLARLEIQIEEIAGKHEDFLDFAYSCLKNGCKDALVDRYYKLHKVISTDNSRDKFEKYFVMARSADAHYKKEEYKEAKAIYEEMMKSEFADEFVFHFTKGIKKVDLPGTYTWHEAKNACGDAWRLPTLSELQWLCDNGGRLDESAERGKYSQLRPVLQQGLLTSAIFPSRDVRNSEGSANTTFNTTERLNKTQYWSSDEVNTNYAFSVTIDDCEKEKQKKMKKYAVRCVSRVFSL